MVGGLTEQAARPFSPAAATFFSVSSFLMSSGFSALLFFACSYLTSDRTSSLTCRRRATPGSPSSSSRLAKFQWQLLAIFFFLLVASNVVHADQVDDAVNGDDAVKNDDAVQQYYSNIGNGDSAFTAGDDYIKYWTDYAILPKRCIV